MERSQWEIIVLKPTSVFLSFLAAQVPESELPDLELIQTDCTAYAIPRQVSEEALLDEIERNFSRMFRHEISRWLGKEVYNEVEASFFDFLCCFKFEVHSQIVLMEPSFEASHQALCVKPKAILLKWMSASIADEGELISVLERVDVSNLVENSTMVVKNFPQLADIKLFIEKNYQPIFETEMSRMCDKEEQWPAVESFEDFSQYFSIEIHTQLVHLP